MLSVVTGELEQLDLFSSKTHAENCPKIVKNIFIGFEFRDAFDTFYTTPPPLYSHERLANFVSTEILYSILSTPGISIYS